MRITAFAVGIIFLVSCSSDEVRKRPSSVLSEDSMAVVLAELQVINAKFQHRDAKQKKLTDFIILEQHEFFDSLGVTQTHFDRSMKYYMQDYVEMQALHDKAMNLLSTRIAKYKSKHPEKEQIKVAPEPKT